jgi:hypothetical protein
VPANPFPLPNPGDIQGQVNQGNSIVEAMSAGDTTALATAGISLAKAAGGSVGADLAGIVSGASAGAAIGAFAGAMSGLACCGPYGAIAAAVITAAVEIVSAFQGSYQGVQLVFPPEASSGAKDAPSVVIANDVANYPVPSVTGNLNVYGDPPGWNLCDYLVTAFPPHTSKRPNLALHLMQAVAREIVSDQISMVASGNTSATNALNSISRQGMKNPLSACGVIAGPTQLGLGVTGGLWQKGDVGLTGGPSVSPKTFMTPGWGWGGGCQALATPVFWQWLDWNELVDVVNNLTFGAGGAGGTASELLGKLKIAIKPLSAKLTQREALVRALQRAPDPLFFDADLYGCVYSPDGTSNTYTMYYNVDLMNGMATLSAMLDSGACTRAILSEFFVQASILVESNALGMGIGNHENVSAGFRALIDDYLALAHMENDDHTATMAKVIETYPSGFMGRVAEKTPSPVKKSPPSPNPMPHVTPAAAHAREVVAFYVRKYLGR